MKEKTLSKEVKDKLAYIADHKELLRVSALEIKGKLSKQVSEQHINRVIGGTYLGRYNNTFVNEILDKTIEIIEEKRAALLTA